MGLHQVCSHVVYIPLKYVTQHEKIRLAYVYKLHLLMLQYVSHLLVKILEIYKLHEIPYESCIAKWCKFD